MSDVSGTAAPTGDGTTPTPANARPSRSRSPSRDQPAPRSRSRSKSRSPRRSSQLKEQNQREDSCDDRNTNANEICDGKKEANKVSESSPAKDVESSSAKDFEGDSKNQTTALGNHQELAAFVNFAAQAVCGTMMVLYKDGLWGHPAYAYLAENNLAVYLNRCWMSLMAQDDEFVTSNYAAMNHRSPVCLTFALFGFCKKLLKEKMSFAVAGVAPWEGHLNTRRNLINSSLKSSLTKMLLEKGAFKVLKHNCHGKTLYEERKEWLAKGRPQEACFTVPIQRVLEIWEKAKLEVASRGTPREVPALRSCSNL